MDLIEKTGSNHRHPWELSRCYNILKMLPKNNCSFADIGAGDQFFTSKILETLLDKLKSNGLIVLTVAAINTIFSSHDIFLKHYRRYNKKSLMALLSKHNIIIKRIHYFYSLLLCVRFISFVLEKLQSKKKQFGVGFWQFAKRNRIFKFNFQYL